MFENIQVIFMSLTVLVFSSLVYDWIERYNHVNC